jgi:hypothetical protein
MTMRYSVRRLLVVTTVLAVFAACASGIWRTLKPNVRPMEYRSVGQFGLSDK